ncbi:MAG: hypothetical protein V7774_08800 [Pseudorhizobium pelagicum]|uniref:hypothetical protein n=1 Tax=Pseudorhizobium pelagicum TaxID=1509405 RepID=UPI003460940D
MALKTDTVNSYIRTSTKEEREENMLHGFCTHVHVISRFVLLDCAGLRQASNEAVTAEGLRNKGSNGAAREI